MVQQKIIETLKMMFPSVVGLEGSILYGSFARGEANPNSDIDIQLLINDDFNAKEFEQDLRSAVSLDIQRVVNVSLRNKIVVYLGEVPKVEFTLCTKLEDINRNYIASRISNHQAAVLYEKTPSKYHLAIYLESLPTFDVADVSAEIPHLINKFIYEFESCSTMHSRSDGYRFYFFYNISFHCLVQLTQFVKGDPNFVIFPENLTSVVLKNEEDRQNFYTMNGSLFLPDANEKKRKLLDAFYRVLDVLVDTKQKEELVDFCEQIYERDYFWNLRDASLYNPTIKNGVLFRSATMTFFQENERFEKVFAENNIATVIDLRADREIDELPYREDVATNFNYVKAPLDPWNQPDWFVKDYQIGTNVEIAYRFFGMGCKLAIKQAVEAILKEDKATLVHCHAGKDRTGIFFSLLHLLVGAPIEVVYTDYLASESDVKKENLAIVLAIVAETGGVVPYLVSCGLTKSQIADLKNKIMV